MNITKDHKILENYHQALSVRGLALSTINTYIQHMYDFLLYADGFCSKEIISYMDALSQKVQARKISRSHYNQAYYSIKHFSETIAKREIPRCIKVYDVPVIPPKIIPIEKFVEAYHKTSILKEKMVLGLLCISMLRREELQLLQIKNIDLNKRIVYVRYGKGAKHRVTILGESTAADIEEYLRNRMPSEKSNPYLFNAYMSVTMYVCKKWIYDTVHNAGIRIGCNDWHPHLLRHSGASYLDQDDTSTRKIQELLGHSKLTTTERYLHPGRAIIDVRNPLDAKILQSNGNIACNG